MDIPKLTEAISEDVLRIYLEGFYRHTGLSVALYVDPESDSPIINPEDCNKVCHEFRDRSRADNCVDRNVQLARDVLDGKRGALGKLRKCPNGLEHRAFAIRHPKKKKPVAVLYFGGRVTTEYEAKKISSENWQEIFMSVDEFKDKERAFRDYAQALQETYRAHAILRTYSGQLSSVTSYKSLGRDVPGFLDSLPGYKDRTFQSLLRYFAEETESELTALLILDRHEPVNNPNTDYFVVRSFWVSESLGERMKSARINPPEIIKVKKSFLGRHLTGTSTNRFWGRDPILVSDINPDEFQWKDVIKLQKHRRVMALPLWVKGEKAPIGVLICFPGRDIWKTEIPLFQAFARKVALSVHLTIQHDNYVVSRRFSQNLGKPIAKQGDDFYSEMAKLMRDALSAQAASIFLVNRSTGYLTLVGTTDESKRALKALRTDVYKVGKGSITGEVAAFGRKRRRGEIIYDLSGDMRRSREFDEKVPRTESGKNSMILTQVRSPRGEVLGVIRCIDFRLEPPGAFNCFNHFHLELLQFWADVFGIILTLNERVDLSHDFIIRHVHEMSSSLQGIMDTIYLARLFDERGDSAVSATKYHDAVKMQGLTQQYLDELKIVSQLSISERVRLAQPEPEWCGLEATFLIPVRDSMRNWALEHRHISIRSTPHRAQVNVDKKQITQVFTNLLRNAVKYSHDPDSPDTANLSFRDIRIETNIDDEGWLCVDFLNWGIGIKKGEQEIIFQLYRQGSNVTSQSVGGVGLGLFLCRQIMQAHGGEINVDRLNNPTVFRIRFPQDRFR